MSSVEGAKGRPSTEGAMVHADSKPRAGEPAKDDPLAGTPYRLIRYVTGGAMGEILEAEHMALRRKVIVKLINRKYASLPGFVDRLRLEAQALAALAPRTPHIVSVLDFGETRDGRPFMVLEQLRGRTLKDELRARRMLPPSEAVGLARDLLAALGCAHDVGIVHRDVKPENIFLAEPERGGRVLKLLDFGLAKVLPGAAGEDAPAPLTLPTEEGVTLGTPRFLSPEQARGGAIDHRSDLYSAGAVLYAMLTGRDPFHHVEGIAAILRAQVSEPPRPPSFVAAQPIPEALDRIVLKALAKEPDDRFASAAELSAALDGALAPAPFTGGSGGTERMDVTVFRGVGRGGRAPHLQDKTEPLDVSVFHGALLRHAAPPTVPKPVSAAAPEEIATARPATNAGAPGPGRRAAGPHPHPTTATPIAAIVVSVMVAASFVAVLVIYLMERVR